MPFKLDISSNARSHFSSNTITWIKKLKNILKKSFEKKIYCVHISFLVNWNSVYLRLLSVIPLYCRTYKYLHRFCSKSSKWYYPCKPLQMFFDALFLACVYCFSFLFIAKKKTLKIPQSSHSHSCKSARKIETKSVNLMILCIQLNALY